MEVGPLWGLKCLGTGQRWYLHNIVNELFSLKWLAISYFASIKKAHFLHSQHAFTFTHPL